MPVNLDENKSAIFLKWSKFNFNLLKIINVFKNVIRNYLLP